MTLEEKLQEEAKLYAEDSSWLGEYVGRKSKYIGQRICSHCGKDITEGWVYNDGQAFYCSDQCVLEHFTKEQWIEYLERSEADSALEPGLAYYSFFGEIL